MRFKFELVNLLQEKGGGSEKGTFTDWLRSLKDYVSLSDLVAWYIKK